MKHIVSPVRPQGRVKTRCGGRGRLGNLSRDQLGISAFSKNLAIEYGMQGLNVNCVCPASIETPMTENHRLPENFDKRLLKKIMPLDGVNRTPDEVASVIAFLASTDAIHINGVDLRVDGGLLT